MAKNWYIVIVPTSKEEVAKTALEQRIKAEGMDSLISKVLIPKEKISEIRGKQKRIIERKRYPGYVFIEMDMNDSTWMFVKETQGVANFLGGREPTPVAGPEIEQILLSDKVAEESTEGQIKIKFKKGDNVRIKEGPFENFEGTVDEVIPAKGMIKVTTIVFNRPTSVELGYWQVEEV